MHPHWRLLIESGNSVSAYGVDAIASRSLSRIDCCSSASGAWCDVDDGGGRRLGCAATVRRFLADAFGALVDGAAGARGGGVWVRRGDGVGGARLHPLLRGPVEPVADHGGEHHQLHGGSLGGRADRGLSAAAGRAEREGSPPVGGADRLRGAGCGAGGRVRAAGGGTSVRPGREPGDYPGVGAGSSRTACPRPMCRAWGRC